jgi:hypothetical protein
MVKAAASAALAASVVAVIGVFTRSSHNLFVANRTQSGGA